MATVTTNLKKLLADAMNAEAGLEIKIDYNIDGVPSSQTKAVTYNVATIAGSDAVAEISANVTFTVESLSEILTVTLQDSLSNALSVETLTTDNTFPNGGDFIITSFEIKVA